jgi:dTDP-4-dehydrorhamnose 3,5-epimerase-like enzyme
MFAMVSDRCPFWCEIISILLSLPLRNYSFRKFGNILVYDGKGCIILMIEGLVVEELSKHIDERGFFVELLRDDHRNLLGDDHIVGTSLSYTVPGIIRAWHRHKLDQRDYLVCIGGSIKVCIFDDRLESTTRGELDEIVLARVQVIGS